MFTPSREEQIMGKIAFWIIVVAAAAILISGKVRLAKRYEREDKTIKDVSSWRSLDRGVDPTENEEESK
jgi:hypothetical protein